MPMTAISTSNSISVNPCRVLVFANRNIAVPLGSGARALTHPALCLVLFPQGSVPDLDFPLALVAAAGGQAPAVRAERHSQDRTGMASEKKGLLRSRHVPDLHGLIQAARSEPPAVRT